MSVERNVKKVLILTVTSGNGHHAASRALKEELESRGGYEVKIVDLLKNFSKPFYIWLIDGGYNIVAGPLLPCYDAYYNRFARANPKRRYNNGAREIMLSTMEGVYREINEYQPDVIYGPHFYNTGVVSFLKLAGYAFPPKVVLSLLDYAHQPFWETGILTDKVTIGSEDFRSWAHKMGYTDNQIIASGVPASTKFFATFDKRAVRAEMGFDPDGYTVLVMFGGGTRGGCYHVLRQLIYALKGKKVQIIMACGRSEKDFRLGTALARKLPEGVALHVLAFTNEIEKYMAAADFAVTKCGGVSSTELVDMGVPFIAPRRLPKQERENLAYFKSKGIAMSYRGRRQLKKVMQNLTSEDRMAMRARALAFRTNGVVTIADWIDVQPYAVYDNEYIAKVDYAQVKTTVIKALKIADKQAVSHNKKQK